MVYLDKHLKKYPLMQIQDILKLHLQGLLGPTHLIKDIERLKNNLINEYEECKDNNINYELIEDISDKYIRVYLKPYYNKYGNFDKLIEMFLKSTNVPLSMDEYVIEIKKLINVENKDFIEQYLNNGNYVISHSIVYKEHYKPHYLVINKKFKGEI